MFREALHQAIAPKQTTTIIEMAKPICILLSGNNLIKAVAFGRYTRPAWLNDYYRAPYASFSLFVNTPENGRLQWRSLLSPGGPCFSGDVKLCTPLLRTLSQQWYIWHSIRKLSMHRYCLLLANYGDLFALTFYSMKSLVIDMGGTYVKARATGQKNGWKSHLVQR
jgi:hypothetical protein